MQNVANFINQSRQKIEQHLNIPLKTATTIATKSGVVVAATACIYFAGKSVSTFIPSIALGLNIGIATLASPVIIAPIAGTIAACSVIGLGMLIINTVMHETPLHTLMSERHIKERQDKCKDLQKQIENKLKDIPHPILNQIEQTVKDDFNHQLKGVNKLLEEHNKRNAQDSPMSYDEQILMDKTLEDIQKSVDEIDKRLKALPKPAASPAGLLQRTNSTP